MTATVCNPTGGRMFLINLFGKRLAMMILKAAGRVTKL